MDCKELQWLDKAYQCNNKHDPGGPVEDYFLKEDFTALERDDGRNHFIFLCVCR